MFDFFDEIFGEIKRGNYRYQVDSGKQIAIEGYRNILKIDNKNIVIKLFDGELIIEGDNLRVKELGTNTIIICGNIKSVCEAGVKND